MTPLAPGLRIVNAPHFHAARPLRERVRLNSGVRIEAGRIVPRDDWRAATAEEWATLMDAGAGGELLLFSIPERLQSLWWSAATSAPAGEIVGPAFEDFAREILAFLRFKKLPAPATCTMEVAVRAPGPVEGLLSDMKLADLLGGINLSDEESALILFNQEADSTERLLRNQCDYPLVRVSLSPGEGFWLPSQRVALAIDTSTGKEVHIQLAIRPAR